MKCIVVGTDLAERSIQAVEQAAELAELSGATLHLVSACANPAVGAAGMEATVVIDQGDYMNSVQTELDSIAGRLGRRPITVETHLSVGSAADALCKVSEAVDADLIVVGNRRTQGASRVLGSVAKRVIQHAGCNVLVAHTG